MANDKLVRLAVPDALADSGLLSYMLPRFTLKTQVRFEIVGESGEADAAFGPDGTPVFVGPQTGWALTLIDPDHPGARRFADWLTSEVGQRAITGFEQDGIQVFALPGETEEETEVAVFDGDGAAGRKLARRKCGRCHVAAPEDRFNSIGSTPSFFVLRAMPDWPERFQVFYVLAPHPAFTQIEDVTDPFPIDRPSPIAPVTMTLDDLDAILAYVAGLEPADLGGPLIISDD